jgi:hypothetical protein
MTDQDPEVLAQYAPPPRLHFHGKGGKLRA